MRCTKEDLDAAVQNKIIERQQAELLWEFLAKRSSGRSGFEVSTVIYYFGGLILLSSMSWFLTTVWDNGLQVLLTALFFGLFYLIAGRSLWKKALEIPGGLLITAAVGLVPVAIYGLQKHLGWWPDGEPGDFRDYHLSVRSSWFFMEMGTITAAALALRFFPFPFLTFPLALSLWYMSLDIAPLLFGQNEFTYDQTLWVSLIFGLATLLFAYLLDMRNQIRDFAFWLYLYGSFAFWCGALLLYKESEWLKFLYCLLNAFLIFFSVFIRRKIFLILGAFGVFGYLFHLAYDIFKDSQAFPIVLSGAGLLILLAGIYYKRHEEKIEACAEGLIPKMLLKARPPKRD